MAGNWRLMGSFASQDDRSGLQLRSRPLIAVTWVEESARS